MSVQCSVLATAKNYQLVVAKGLQSLESIKIN